MHNRRTDGPSDQQPPVLSVLPAEDSPIYLPKSADPRLYSRFQNEPCRLILGYISPSFNRNSFLMYQSCLLTILKIFSRVSCWLYRPMLCDIVSASRRSIKKLICASKSHLSIWLPEMICFMIGVNESTVDPKVWSR